MLFRAFFFLFRIIMKIFQYSIYDCAIEFHLSELWLLEILVSARLAEPLPIESTYLRE